MKYLMLILFITAVLVTPNAVFAQCSDAGVCIVGKNLITDIVLKKSSVSLGYVYGQSGKDPDINGDLNNLTFNSAMFDADLEVFRNTRIGMSIPFTFISGPYGENNGVGDLAVVVSKSFSIKKFQDLTLVLGGRFATGSVNTNDSLPQRYMPGLGTNDLLAGAIYTIRNYYFGIGYQNPFGRSNNYVTRLKRGDDVLIRAGFFEQFNKIGVKAEILTILRIQPSSILDTTASEESFIEIDGSNEAQVNLLGTVSFRASDGLGLTGQAAIPMLKRNYNFDGLKRTFSFSLTASYFFNIK
jgi:hypothetical protein